MKEILKLYKNLGETPLECIERFRADNPAYKGIKMTYLGRLDPMAEGLLLVLAGDTRAKDMYLSMDKTYEFEVLWGFETDTYDVLGKVVSGSGKMPKLIEERIEKMLSEIQKKKVQDYPPYSSKTVRGIPLFEYARQNKIEEIEIPQRGIKIFSIEHLNTRLVGREELLKEIISKIELVKGDFRQSEISHCWAELLSGKYRVFATQEESFLVSSFKADVSSGTYIRGLAHQMGKFFGGGAIAFWIKRTRVGEYKL